MSMIREVNRVPEMEISLLERKFLTYFDLFSKNKIGTIEIIYTPNYFVILGVSSLFGARLWFPLKWESLGVWVGQTEGQC